MFGPMHPNAILNYAETLAKAIHALRGYPAIVEGMNTFEESVPKHNQTPEPESEPDGSARVSALRRRWLFLRDAACSEASEVLAWCSRAVRFSPGLGNRLFRLADKVEDLCPLYLVNFCNVCDARELTSRLVFAGERAVCEACVRGALYRANALRIPGEPVMTEAFLHELLSLHRVPHWRLDGWNGDASPVVVARNAKDAEIRRERLMSLGDLGHDTQRRWLIAIAPIAACLETFAEFMAATRRGGPDADPGEG
jgi:hypothetical protein